MAYLNKEEVDKYMIVISETVEDSQRGRSTSILSAFEPRIQWEFGEEEDKYNASVVVKYIPRSNEIADMLFGEFSFYEFPILKMEDDTKNVGFYDNFLKKFIKILIWGKDDMDISNILAGKANFNWLHGEDNIVTMKSIMVDLKAFHLDTQVYWKDKVKNYALVD